jgi:cholesterol oxidase
MNTQSPGKEAKDQVFDFVIVGSGFGGSVSAMRLTEKGYRVLVLERGKRYNDQDFPRTNWNIWKYLWLPALRCFGSFQMSLFRGLFVFHSSSVGGGSQVYACVLMEPDDTFFTSPGWGYLEDWKTVLQTHYQTARRMLGVTTNPRLWPSDEALREIAEELGQGETFRPTEVGVFFGEEGKEVPDPYFGGQGPSRAGCVHCGGCMVGCRFNAKNSLLKNYLYFAEKNGAEVRPESQVHDIRPLDGQQNDGARYEVHYRSSTAWLYKPTQVVRARHVVVSAGVIGTLQLLLRCRDVIGSLPNLSPRLGESVRSNSEAFLGAFGRSDKVDHSEGLAITSIFHADESTQVEPLRFADGSSMIFWLTAAPLIGAHKSIVKRITKMISAAVRRPSDIISNKFMPGLSRRGTALMIMQTKHNFMRLKLGRTLFTLFRRGLVAEHDEEQTIPVDIALGHQIGRAYAEKIHGDPMGSLMEGLLNVPTTAHMLGGCMIGRDPSEGVVDRNCEIFNYPGLYVVDGSIVPANPGINPSLTITALAEYAMSLIPTKEGLSQL